MTTETAEVQWKMPQHDCPLLEWRLIAIRALSNDQGELELFCCQTLTLVHTWSDVLADDNWNCSALHSRLVSVLFFLHLSMLPAVSPHLPSPPSHRPSPLHPCPFSLTELLFIHHFFLFPPSFSHYLASVLERHAMVLRNGVLRFTQCAWLKLIRVIRCSLPVVLPLKWKLSFLCLLLPYHLTFWRLHGWKENTKGEREGERWLQI